MNSISKRDDPLKAEVEGEILPAATSERRIGNGRRLVAALFRKANAADDEEGHLPYFRPLSPRIPWLGISFLLCVVIPSVVGVFYLAIVAAPQFSVEARLIVRAAEPTILVGDKLGAAASLGASVSYSATAQNAYVVAQYIKSRAAIDDLLTLVDLREIYRRPEADFWARLKNNASQEELVSYWRDMVRSYVDSASSIVIVEVQAFRADDALRVAQAIITLSERLVNQMSLRARQDVMRFSEEEVRRADALIRTALDDLQKARDTEGILDPAKAADEVSRLLMQLMAEKIKIEGELYFASRSLDKTSGSVRQLTSRLEIVEGQIATLRATLTGGSGQAPTMASSLRKFEQLEVQRFLADKVLTFAEDGLERARVKAERQSLYFMVFVPPSLPTKAMLPHRLAYSILLPIIFLILWGIGALLWASVEDHRT